MRSSAGWSVVCRGIFRWRLEPCLRRTELRRKIFSQMEREIQDVLRPYVVEIAEAITGRCGHLLIAGPDPQLLAAAQEMIAASTPYRAVHITTQRAVSCDRRIFFVPLEPRPSLQYQALLYYYLELPRKHSCFVCLVSTSSLCLNTLEKRVRSRFRNRIFFIPYLPIDGAKSGKHCQNTKNTAAGRCDLNSKEEGETLPDAAPVKHADLEYSAYPTVAARKRKMFMEKHGLEPFSLSLLFDLLEPIHFALIAIANKRRLRCRDAVEAYRSAVTDVSEVKGARSSVILFCYHDLVDAEIIGTAGDLLVDFGELRSFVQSSCPAYVKKMIERLGR